MNIIADTLTMYWTAGRKTKKTPSGWLTGNAPCCQDKRQRGGFIVTPEGSVSYHCFNCQFKASFTVGRHLTQKMRQFMTYLNIPDSEINKLILAALQLEESDARIELQLLPTFEKRALPKNARPISNYLDNIPNKLLPVLEYMAQRNLCLDDYPFYWTPEIGMNNRLIIPFFYDGKIVGYTARIVVESKTYRYISDQQPNYVFNLDHQTDDRQFVIVCEGPLDAISIDGCGILGSEIKVQQDWLLKRLHREIILVPDKDAKGKSTVEQAIEYKWSVSMPDWPEGIKDVNDAVVKLGRLATLWLIIQAKQSYSLKIRLRAKQYFKEMNK